MSSPDLRPDQLRHVLLAAARCDATVTSKAWLRAFWYDENWSDGATMAKFDNGGGDHVFVIFTPSGKTLIKGFDHESAVSPHAREEFGIWPGIYDGLPAVLDSLVKDEAVEHEDVTFCCWSVDGLTWETGTAQIPEGIDDGSSWLLPMIQMGADDFIAWGKTYYGANFKRIGEKGVLDEFKRAAL